MTVRAFHSAADVRLALMGPDPVIYSGTVPHQVTGSSPVTT
jgi:hypothetical protein